MTKSANASAGRAEAHAVRDKRGRISLTLYNSTACAARQIAREIHPQGEGRSDTVELGDLRGKLRVPFARTEVSVLRDPTISPQCKALYSLLISYGPGRIFPSHETLAECMGVKCRVIASWLQELRRHGLIDWVQTGRSNQYRIFGPRCAAGDTSDVQPGAGQMCTPEQVRCAPGDTRSRSIHPDPPIQREAAETAASAPPSFPVSSQEEPGGNGARRPGRSKRKARDGTPPAVEVFRRATGRYPQKSWLSDVARAVGEDEADLAFWYDVCKAFVGRGWNPMNVQGMLERYERREIPGSAAARRRGRRGEHQSYTVKERDALWAQHRDAFLALVEQGRNPNIHLSEFTRRLGVTEDEADMLRAAYSIESALREEPIDVAAFFGPDA